MSISGKSENRRIHSLKPDINKESRNCFNIANPTKRGNDESPSNSLSHRCNILCNGNTSKILVIFKFLYQQLIICIEKILIAKFT